MLFAALVFFCVMILTVTHVLDNSLRRSGIRKGHFLIFNGVFFLASLAPPFSLNRYFSVQADAALMLACFVILLFMRKRTLLAFKELSVIFFTALIFLVEILCSLVMEVDWFLYAAAGGMAFYAALYIRKPGDAAVCAFFGMWLMQIFSILKSVILDSYIFFDFGNARVMEWSLICGVAAYLLSDIVQSVVKRRLDRRAQELQTDKN